MLEKLQIRNYALIEDLEIDFGNGFNILTGETGAGKSILLGALGLILGRRADLGALRNTDKKCVIEADFRLDPEVYKEMFDRLDLDFELDTVIRRELLPSGKSRSFVNDSPVTLGVLNQIRPFLIDIHSQHQTLDLAEVDFQYQLLDLVGNHSEELKGYKSDYKVYTGLKKNLQDLKAKESELKAQYDYNSFLLNELESLDLDNIDEEELENLNLSLSNAEEIKAYAVKSFALIEENEIGIEHRFSELLQLFYKLNQLSPQYSALSDRLNSLNLDFIDVVQEFKSLSEGIEISPEELDRVNGLLGQLHHLKQKHQVLTLEDLIKKRDELAVSVEQIDNFDQDLEALNSEIQAIEKKLFSSAQSISQGRKEAAEKIKESIEKRLDILGMPNAKIQFQITQDESFNPLGKDKLNLLFSANKGSELGMLKKVASGGELSRIMLSIKELMASFQVLPTLVFDEIDTGVSGDIAFKMGDMMSAMSEHIQVICISHLPQVAALGHEHFKVYKRDVNGHTQTFIKNLEHEDRIKELAEMLGGKDFGNTAIQHAKELLMD